MSVLSLSEVSFECLLAREARLVKEYCRLAKVAYPGKQAISKAYQQAESAWENLTEHDRFVPGSIGLPEAFQFFYAFNNRQKQFGRLLLRLGGYQKPRKEWWRHDKNIQHLPTKAGVIRCDLKLVECPNHWKQPYNLRYDELAEWAQQQGGDGLTSAEETLYLLARSVLEHGYSWGEGYGLVQPRKVSRSSRWPPFIRWCAAYGLRAERSIGTDAVPGAIPWKFIALVS